jgi:protein-L-isoaspartate(D-aspartate) O-methyltransferase
VLAEQARRRLDELGVTNVTIHVGDGSVGLPAEAPFDGIISGAAPPELPQAWLAQLADGGRIVAPIGPVTAQDLRVVEKTPAGPRAISVCGVRFVKLIGQQGYRS